MTAPANPGQPEPVWPNSASASPEPLSPDRLTRLLDGAVQAVTPRPGAFERIQRGVRRRRALRRVSAILLAVAMLVGGGLTVLALAAGGAPARLGSLSLPPPTLTPSTPAPSSPGPATSTAYLATPAPFAVPPGRFATAAEPPGRPDAMAEAKAKAASGAIPGSGDLAGSQAQPSFSPPARPIRP
jgi:hypothetical protein